MIATIIVRQVACTGIGMLWTPDIGRDGMAAIPESHGRSLRATRSAGRQGDSMTDAHPRHPYGATR